MSICELAKVRFRRRHAVRDPTRPCDPGTLRSERCQVRLRGRGRSWDASGLSPFTRKGANSAFPGGLFASGYSCPLSSESGTPLPAAVTFHYKRCQPLTKPGNLRDVGGQSPRLSYLVPSDRLIVLTLRHCIRSLHRCHVRRRSLAGASVLCLPFVLVSCNEPAETRVDRATELLQELGGPGASPKHLGGLLDTPTPSISVAVAANGDIVFSGAVGFADLESETPATPSTVYNIGSVSKTIAGVAVMQLVERGRVDLEDPIQKYAPSFPDKGWPITIWHLMTHTSGIRHYTRDDFPDSPVNENMVPFASLEDAIGIFKDDPLLFEPGTYFQYSSYAVNLLQGVVEAASGLGFEEYLSNHVWGPAGMVGARLDIPERIVPHRAEGYRESDGRFTNYPYGDLTYKFAGGGMIATVEDLVRFGLAVTRGTLLHSDTVEQMLTPQLGDEFVYFDDRTPLRWKQLLLWRTRIDEEGRPYVNTCGTVAGFNACLIIYRDEDLIVAVADNAWSTGLVTARAFANLFRD